MPHEWIVCGQFEAHIFKDVTQKDFKDTGGWSLESSCTIYGITVHCVLIHHNSS